MAAAATKKQQQYMQIHVSLTYLMNTKSTQKYLSLVQNKMNKMGSKQTGNTRATGTKHTTNNEFT